MEEYTKPTLMLVGEASALVLGLDKVPEDGEDDITHNRLVGMVTGLDD